MAGCKKKEQCECKKAQNTEQESEDTIEQFAAETTLSVFGRLLAAVTESAPGYVLTSADKYQIASNLVKPAMDFLIHVENACRSNIRAAARNNKKAGKK